jgi:hypothetical protein
VINEYEKGRSLIVIQDKVALYFPEDSIAVKVDVFVEDEVESDTESS